MRNNASAAAPARPDTFTSNSSQSYGQQSSTQSYGSYGGRPSSSAFGGNNNSNNNNRYNSSGGNTQSYQRNGPPTQGGGGGRRFEVNMQKDPSDPFFNRTDVSARDKGLESRMFGTAQVITQHK